MSNDIDIGQMISGSTADVSVSDLSRRGFKKVRVLNQAAIKNLIMQAVDRVLESREEDISRAERQRVIEESRQQFEALVHEKVSAERERADRVEDELKARQEEISLVSRELASVREELETNVAARQEAEEKASRLADEVAALQEQAAKLRGELEERAAARATEVASLEAELAGLREAHEALQGERQTREAASAQRDEEIVQLREWLGERDGEIERCRADVQRLTEELSLYRPKAVEPPKPADNVGMMELTGLFRELLHELKSNADNQGKQQASELRESMEVLADRISRGIAAAGGGSRGGGSVGAKDSAEEVMAAFFALNQTESVESNLGQVSPKKTQAKKGVASSLEKLKSMQRSGGTQGGS